MAHLRQLALKNKTPDVYRVHHGNISAVLREQAEDEMKSAQEKLVTGATVTLELGIDIGSLDQVVQVGTPATVSSFAQRLGRCGRRGQIPQILFTFMDDVHTTAADQLGPINWSFLRMIAIIELYTKQKWVEPLTPGRYPYSMLYHQTMSYLLSAGEATARELMGAVLRLSCFQEIPQEDYRILLRHLLLIGHLQKMESGGLIIGRAGEKVVSDYHFLAVFQVPEYYLVKDENRSIGTVDKIYPQHAFCPCWANVGNAGGEPEGQGVICQAGAGHLDCGLGCGLHCGFAYHAGSEDEVYFTVRGAVCLFERFLSGEAGGNPLFGAKFRHSESRRYAAIRK
mgnify:FL=1